MYNHLLYLKWKIPSRSTHPCMIRLFLLVKSVQNQSLKTILAYFITKFWGNWNHHEPDVMSALTESIKHSYIKYFGYVIQYWVRKSSTKFCDNTDYSTQKWAWTDPEAANGQCARSPRICNLVYDKIVQPKSISLY